MFDNMPSFQGSAEVYDMMARGGLTPERIRAELPSTDESELLRRYNFLFYMHEYYVIKQDDAGLQECFVALIELETVVHKRYQERVNELMLELMERGVPDGMYDLTPLGADKRLQQCLSHYNPESGVSFFDYLEQAIQGRLAQDVQDLGEIDASILLDPVRSRKAIADSLVAEALESLTPYQRVIACLTNGWKRQLKEEWIDQSRFQGRALWNEEELKEFVRGWNGREVGTGKIQQYARGEDRERLMDNLQATVVTADLKLTQWVRIRLTGSVFDPIHAIQVYLESQPDRDQAIREILGQEGTPGARLKDLQKFYFCLFLNLRDHVDLNWLPPEHRHKFQKWKEGQEGTLTPTEIGRRLGYAHATGSAARTMQKMTFDRIVTFTRIEMVPAGVGTPLKSKVALRDAFYRRLDEGGHLKTLLELEGEDRVLTDRQKVMLCFTQGLKKYMNWEWIEDPVIRERAKEALSNWEDGESITFKMAANILGINAVVARDHNDKALKACEDWDSIRRGEAAFDPKEALEQIAAQEDRKKRFAGFIKHLNPDQRKVFCVKYGFPEGLTPKERVELIDSRKWDGQRVTNANEINTILQLSNDYKDVYPIERVYLKKLSKTLRMIKCSQ